MKPIVIGLSALCLVFTGLIIYGLFTENATLIVGVAVLLFSIWSATMFSLGMWFVHSTQANLMNDGANIVLKTIEIDNKWDERQTASLAKIYQLGLKDKGHGMPELPAPTPTDAKATVEGNWLDLTEGIDYDS